MGRPEVGVVDYHTGGEPFRIVVSGGPEIPGTTVAERREYARSSEEVDQIRRLLVNEPRGHADMYGGFLGPADDDGAEFGVLFWHKDGYSTACGHGTIALGAWAVTNGLVEAPATGEVPVVIDVPSASADAGTPSRKGVNGAIRRFDALDDQADGASPGAAGADIEVPAGTASRAARAR